MADLDSIDPDDIPTPSDDEPTDQPVANPEAVPQEDQDDQGPDSGSPVVPAQPN